MNELGVFRVWFSYIQGDIDEIKTIAYLVKDRVQNSIEKVTSKNKNEVKLLWLDIDGIKMCTMNPLGKLTRKETQQHKYITYSWQQKMPVFTWKLLSIDRKK